MLALSERGEPVDLITLSEELEQQNLLETVGGISYLTTLANIVPGSNVSYYARIVQEKAVLRSMINTATQIVSRCFEAKDDVEEILDDAEKLF